MAIIKILPEQVVNRIAAGEVVERPASVVKELVENSFDAGALKVEVFLENGGKDLIRVKDNGCGMSEEDARLAFERYATSKIQRVEDLDHILSFGFRGEALPSIASVSRIQLFTRIKDEELGTFIALEGGKITQLCSTSANIGTDIYVKDLFYNAPVRRKFLKGKETELQYILSIITREAMAMDNVELKLSSDGRLLFHSPVLKDKRERLSAIFGGINVNSLVEFEYCGNDLTINGFLGGPEMARTRRDYIYLFVNGRSIADRGLLHSLLKAYSNLLPEGKFPFAIIYIKIDTSKVDVNVHPTKQEVRFSNPGEVYDLLKNAVVQSLRKAFSINGFDLQSQSVHSVSSSILSSTASSKIERLKQADLWSGKSSNFKDLSAFVNPASPLPSDIVEKTDAISNIQEVSRLESSNLNIIGQFLNTYILVQEGENLLLIDQHICHERIIFERLLEQWENAEIEVQMLLFPEAISVRADEALFIDSHLSELKQLGFELEIFGAGTYLLRSIPLIMGDSNASEKFLEILNELMDEQNKKIFSDSREAILATLSCKSAIKAGDFLNLPEMEKLVSDLFKTKIPTTCPHGRPIIIRITEKTIKKAFKRL